MKRWQYEKLKDFVQPGDIIYTGYENFISRGISRFQRLRVNSWEADFSHVGFIDCFGNMVESCITRKGLKLVSGVHVRPLSSWIKNDQARIVVQRFPLTPEQIKRISEIAYRLREKKMFYPILELAGTAWMIAQYTVAKKLGMHKTAEKILNQQNVFDNHNARVCIAFSSHCFKGGASLPLVANEENCTVPEGIMKGHIVYEDRQI